MAMAVLAVYALPARAEIVTCALDRVTLKADISNAEQNTVSAVGRAFRVDTSKNLVQVRFDDGVTNWIAPNKVTKNSSFTAYIFLIDGGVSSDIPGRKVQKISLSYRLRADKKSGEARREVAGGRYYPLAAKYKCK